MPQTKVEEKFLKTRVVKTNSNLTSVSQQKPTETRFQEVKRNISGDNK